MIGFRHDPTKSRAGITIIEILIAVSIFAVAFMPVASVIFSTSRKTNEMNFEVVAETIAKNILEQVLKNVKFEDVKPTMSVGVGATGALVNLDMSGATISGSVITVDKQDYKFEFEIADIKAGDMKMSFPNFVNTSPAWSGSQKGTGNDGLAKLDEATFLNYDVKKFIGGNADLVLMKTVKLRMSWKHPREADFNDPVRCFVLVTRKAKIEGSLN